MGLALFAEYLAVPVLFNNKFWVLGVVSGIVAAALSIVRLKRRPACRILTKATLVLGVLSAVVPLGVRGLWG